MKTHWMGYVIAGMCLQFLGTLIGLALSLAGDTIRFSGELGVVTRLEAERDTSTTVLVAVAAVCALVGLALQVVGLYTAPQPAPDVSATLTS